MIFWSQEHNWLAITNSSQVLVWQHQYFETLGLYNSFKSLLANQILWLLSEHWWTVSILEVGLCFHLWTSASKALIHSCTPFTVVVILVSRQFALCHFTRCYFHRSHFQLLAFSATCHFNRLELQTLAISSTVIAFSINCLSCRVISYLQYPSMFETHPF